MIRLPTTTLNEFQTLALIPLESRTADTYFRLASISGNSILSSVFVKSMDPGATLFVRYWDTTTGGESSEQYPLGEHRIVLPGMLGVKGYTDRETFTRIHDKVFCEVVVSGGAVEFGVYVTVVSSFATDLDAALQHEGDDVSIPLDKGIPITVYESTDDTWKFLRSTNGRLQVDVPGGIQVTQVIPNLRHYARTLPAIPGAVNTQISYTVPTGKQFYWIAGEGTGSTWTRWIVSIDGARYLVKRNAFDFPNVALNIGSPLLLTAGQNIIRARPVSFYITMV
jgi:hypothetical protein